ncbi:hypothetical protein LXL04_017087 [Taraxacum kok-saghyz]
MPSLGIMNRVFSKVRNLDAYPKVNEDFYSRTLSGGVITLASSIAMLFLIYSEFGKIPSCYSFDITFPAVSCTLLSLDAIDISGEQHLDIKHSVMKNRIDPDGHIIQVKYDKIGKPNMGKPMQKHGGDLQDNETYCGSCFGAELSHSECCNTCDEVREAYRRKGWGLMNPDLIDQCKREGFVQRIKAEEGEGCNVYGSIVVPTVYKSISGPVIKSNQFSVTEHYKGPEVSSRGLPGVFFFYDLSPIKDDRTERDKRIPRRSRRFRGEADDSAEPYLRNSPNFRGTRLGKYCLSDLCETRQFRRALSAELATYRETSANNYETAIPRHLIGFAEMMLCGMAASVRNLADQTTYILSQQISISMASSSSSSALPVSSHSWKYDVFLSFRGEDTRKTFVDHLYSALLQQGIRTYKDDETLPRGESISPSLEKAIEESEIALVIFSENYADSSWCLGELAYIMKCNDTRGTTVMPIFYGVEPSTVRKQKYKYGEAFSKHELENKDRVESWRQALVDASNFSGWDPKDIANGHESKAVKEIVETISRSLSPLTSSANKDLIGIEARVKDLISVLEIGSGGVRMIGIWGVGGGGKTTLALSVYGEISSRFDGCCFIENIREESSKQGLEKLQETIISNIFKQNKMEVSKVGARWLPHERLRRIKVLILLDDVDHLDQLEMLVGSHTWFGEGSRIVITTRDKHVLTAHRVNVIYNIRLLNNDEAINLLHKHARRDYRSMADYEMLCKDVVSYARGLPLALKVLGRFLCDKDIKEWRSTLARLKAIPEFDIVEKLKISYDGLRPYEKELFLDIACFYKGFHKNENLMAVFTACGFHPDIGVKVLVQKALITISRGTFDMHDLVQDMGHYIVRGKYPNNPEKHSRVWKKEDILKICDANASQEFDMIEAINLDDNPYAEIELVPPPVANMKNLRLFELRADLASPFPTNFSPVELRCLILDGISQKQLWNDYKHLPNLKIMQLCRLKNLVITPDFRGLPNLERLVLDRCPCLEKIHPSIGCLPKLVFLVVEECCGLKMFPPIARLKTLEIISFAMCPNIFNLSELQQKKMDNLSHLHLDNSGKKAASVKKYSTNLFVSCWMCGDREVTKPGDELIDVDVEQYSLPPNNMNHHTISWFLPTCFRILNLSACNVGDKDIGLVVWELPNLEQLILAGNSFTRLNFSVLRVPRLKKLYVTNCKDLVELIELPSSIAVVLADYCSSLESYGDVSNCKWLWKVSLMGKNKLGPHGGDILLDSILQGNALQDHFITFNLQHQMIPKGFVVIKHLTDEDSPFELWQESNEGLDRNHDKTTKYVGYISFSSLRLLNSPYNIISFSTDVMYLGEVYEGETYLGVELVPKKSKVDEVQATDCSEFWDKESEDTATFTIQHDSKSSIKIIWRPHYYSMQALKVVVKVDVQNDEEKDKALMELSSVPGIAYKSIDMEEKKLTVMGHFFADDIINKLKKYWHTERSDGGNMTISVSSFAYIDKSEFPMFHLFHKG